MADYNSSLVSHQVLKELYHEIYKLHWSYLELEDGMQKIEEQKLLEGLLKKFLCVVPHNRKFFLPETFAVFKQTVTQMKDFSAVKMLNGFESISQYANNLFTKPWRKEYRTIKMYSGFFIHEIKSNLIEPEELFVAMGYKKMPNHELVLDGEICPDQIMNMSRDAMTAYTECKIMNRIYSELTTTYKISCSLMDVFNYREKHTGGVTETIEAIKNLIQQQHSSLPACIPTRDKQLIMGQSCYQQPQCIAASANHIPPPPLPPASTCNSEYLSNHYQTPCGGSQLPAVMNLQQQSQQSLLHHHHHHYDQQQQQQPVLSGNLMVGQSFDNNNQSYYHHHHHPGGGMMANTTNGSLTAAAAAGGGCPATGMLPMCNATISTANPSTSYSNGVARLSQQQQIYSPHNHHLAGASSICDYGATISANSMPHSKSMDHYSYPTMPLQSDQHLMHHHHHHNQQQQHPHSHQLPSSVAAFENHQGLISSSRSHGNVNGIGGNGGGGIYYEPTTATNSAAAESYNVSGTRYPLPYSISSQFGQAQHNTGMGMDQWNGGGGNGGLGGYYDPTMVNMMNNRCDNGNPENYLSQQLQGMMMMNGSGLQQAQLPVATPRTQYYSQLIMKPQANDQQTNAYLESSDEVDRFAGGNNKRSVGRGRQVGGGGGVADSSQQTPRTSDFDSYEELFGGRGGGQQRVEGMRRNSEMSSTRNKTRSTTDKIQDGVGSFEAWDYVYQALDTESKKGKEAAAPPPVEPVRTTNGGRSTITSKEAMNKSKTMSRQEANKIQEQISHLRTVKPVTMDQGDELDRRERRSSGHHQKSNSIGGGGGGLKITSSMTNGSHQRQASDSGIGNGGLQRATGKGRGVDREKTGSGFNVESLPPPVLSTEDEWSCRFCTFLNDNSNRICEMCAKSRDFNLDGKSTSATCV